MNTFSDSLVTALRLILSGDPGLWTVVMRSLAVSATACLLACGLGLLMGAWLAAARFPGRGAVLTVLNTFLAVPSVVVGLVIYLLLSRSGPLGFLGWLFSFQAMVLAQTVLVLPLVTALTRQVVEDSDRDHGEQLSSLGAGRGLRSLLVAWDERYALLTVFITAFMSMLFSMNSLSEPASIFDISSTSLIRLSRWRAVPVVSSKRAKTSK